MNKWSRFLGLMMPAFALLAALGVADAGLAMTPQVAAGKDFTVTLRSDGTIWSSGSNDQGQLGDGTVLQSNTPVQAGLPGNGVNWTAVAAGVDHTVAIRADGTLWGWGANDFGQLGKGFVDPQPVPTPSPVRVGTGTDWIAVAAGASCTLALKADGTLWAWGLNNIGQLGDGTTVDKSLPVPVLTPGASAYVAVSITNAHVLALQADGTLWTWGSNLFGQLGIGAVDAVSHATPIQFKTGDLAFDTAWTAVSSGGWHSIAQQSDGTLWSWGRNNFGQLGNGSGSANNVPSPAKVGFASDWAGFSAGEFTTVAFKRNGSLWSWGANNKGQLGIGGAVGLLPHSTPVQITDPAEISNITAVAAGSGHSLAATASGDLYAWGDNLRGQLGTGANINNVTTSSTVPLLVTQNAIMWVSIDAGGQHTLARRSNGTLWAFGDNSSGQGSLYPLSTTEITNPVQVESANNWSVLTGGLLHSVALQTDGTLWSWGSNTSGQLGDGTTSDHFAPQQITITSPDSLSNEWFTLSSGDAHTLALQDDGSLWAWGDNSAGQLGDGTTNSQLLPTRIITGNPSNFDNNWVAVSAGGLYSVGLQADGTLWVWGDNSSGQFGIDPGIVASSFVPFQIINFTPVAGNPGFNSSWTSVSAGFTHLLALQANGTAWGLGANSAGQLGTGTSSAFESAFTQVLNPGAPVIPFVAIAAGDSHSVALKADGSIWSMGNNTSGQLGVDNTGDTDPLLPSPHATPLRESTGANNWVAVSAGGRHTVALKANGTLATWGDNSFGQQGDGTTDPHSSPTLLKEGRISVPAATSFGSVSLTGPYPTVSTTIVNIGTGTLAVSSIAVGGANSTMFTIAPSSTCTPPQTIAPTGSCRVDVKFTPSALGQKSATLNISSNDPVAPTTVVGLQGLSIDNTAPDTTPSPVAGTFIAPVNVTLTANETATIKYTTDGSNPATSGTAVTYSGPVSIAATTTLKFFATDTAGNAEAVKTRVYTIHTADLVASVQINGGASTTNSTAATLTLAATDATGVASMRFSNDGVTYSADEPYATSKAWTLSSGEGVKTVFVRFIDGAGLLYDPVISQITMDTTAPVTTPSPTAGTFIAPVNVTLTANETATIKYTTDGNNPATSGTAVTYSGPVSIAATTTLKFFATDTAGNAEAVKTRVYAIHTADLVASVQINGGASTTNSTAATLTLAATDATGVASMRFSNDGVAYSADEPYATSKAWTLSSGEGVKTVFVRFTDGAGLLYDPVISQITLDTTAPVTTPSPAAGTFIAAFSVTLNSNETATIKYTIDGSDPATSGTAGVYSGPISIAATTTLKFFATDLAGNAEAVKSGVYTIHTADLEASVKINGGASTTNSTAATLTLAATDATGVASMRFSNDGVAYSADEPYATSKAWTLSSGEGVKAVFVRFTDGAGLLYDPVVGLITLDTTAPVTTPSPAAGTFIAPVNVALTDSETATIKYTIDSSDPVTSGTAITYSGPVSISSTTTLKYFGTDTAGNVEAVKTGVYTIHTADLVASVRINGGASTTNNTAATLTLAAEDSEGVALMRFSNDGVTYSADEPYAASKAWTLSSGNGVKTVYVRFTDGAGLLYDPVVGQITLNSNGIRDGLLPGSGSYLHSALRALQIAIGNIPPTPQELAHGDVAPYYGGAAHPNGTIDLGDASVMLLLSVGTINGL